jgi:hypothetical protein
VHALLPRSNECGPATAPHHTPLPQSTINSVFPPLTVMVIPLNMHFPSVIMVI